MDIQFDTLFEVEILNTYYKTDDNPGISEDFTIEPTYLCKQQLQKFGLLWRQTKKGFQVFYEYTEDTEKKKHPLKPMKGDLTFSFILKSLNPFLFNYSDLPLDGKIDDIFYLHNLNNNKQGDGLFLAADVQKDFVTGEDRIKLKPQVFQYYFESTKSSSEVEIVDIVNGSIVKETVPVIKESDAGEKGFCNYLVNLRNSPPGKYTLKIDGEQKLMFYANDELIGKNVFGIVDIFRNDSVSEAYQFTDQNHDVKEKTYTIKLKNRETFWRYYVIIKYQLKDEKLNKIPDKNPEVWPGHWPKNWAIIYPSHSPVELKPPLDDGHIKTFADGTVAALFVSNEPLSLQKKPVNGIQLKKINGGNGHKELRDIDNLPNPSIRTLTEEKKGDVVKVYSEIIVYI